jgi:hypothetical protein
MNTDRNWELKNPRAVISNDPARAGEEKSQKEKVATD